MSPSRCTPPSVTGRRRFRALMHRNVAVLKGLPPDFPPPTVAFYYGGRGGAGTRHALGVAEYLRVPAVDLS